MKAPLQFFQRRLLAFAGTILLATSGHAQLVNDGATNTLSNITTNIVGNVTVGTNGSFTLLVLSSSCQLSNSGFSTIGQNVTAKSNEVRLVSPTARWFMGAGSANSLFVGSNSAFNRLVVSNGATAAGQGQAFLGYISESASNNQVWVTGTNSVWSSAQTINVGLLGSGNQVVVSNGGTVLSVNAVVGASTITSNNLALVTGAGSLWSNAFTFSVGANGSGNRLLVSEGGVVRSSGIGRIGGELLSGSGNNLALITGSGSVWSNTLDLEIGRSSGINNQLVVSNGASVFVSGSALLGMSSGANANSVLVTDAGTSWFVLNNLYVGSNGALSRLVVSNGATVAANNLFVGLNAPSTNNRVVVDGGTLRVTNAAGTSVFDVRSRGTNVLNAGLVEVDQLLVTNAVGAAFELNGGTLSAGKTTVGNGQLFGVGNGVSPATFNLAGNGTHSFANGLAISNNAVLAGNGTVTGTLTVRPGGTLTPGDAIGKIVLSNSPSLQGAVVMEISKNGSVLTNDQIQVTGTLTYGGDLIVTKLGPTVLAHGDRFQLFPAGPYAGSFSSITLPALAPELSWTNKLLVDGSIELTSRSGLITYLKASNTEASDFFGTSVAVSGDTIVIRANGEDSNATGVNGDQNNNSATNSGAAYVFVRSGTNWIQQAYLKASNTDSNDQFGQRVAVSGDTIVVGAPFESSAATGVNGDQNNNSAIDSGAAYVFVRSGTNWIQQAYLKASNTEAVDIFGESVAISGDTIVVGADREDGSATGVNGDQNDNSAIDSGAAYVFVRNGTNWSQQAYLKASNTGVNDFFGTSVTVSGDTIVVGAQGESSAATGVNGDQNNNFAAGSGAAYVFVRDGTNWTQQAYLKASNTGAGDVFGGAVSLSGDTVVVGANAEDSNATGVNGNQINNTASAAGAAYVFARSGTNWSQQAYLKASNTERLDQFGNSVAVSGDTVVVGAREESSNATGVNGNQNNNLAAGSGAAYVFVRNGTNWSQQYYLKASNTGATDGFGSGVSLSGDTVVVGAGGEDSNATGVNGDQSDNSAQRSGAAYVFDLSLLNPPVLNIVQSSASQVTLLWTPPTPGFVLQETLTLSPVSWSNSPSGETNPITLPVTEQTKFFRLFKP